MWGTVKNGQPRNWQSCLVYYLIDKMREHPKVWDHISKKSLLHYMEIVGLNFHSIVLWQDLSKHSSPFILKLMIVPQKKSASPGAGANESFSAFLIPKVSLSWSLALYLWNKKKDKTWEGTVMRTHFTKEIYKKYKWDGVLLVIQLCPEEQIIILLRIKIGHGQVISGIELVTDGQPQRQPRNCESGKIENHGD